MLGFITLEYILKFNDYLKCCGHLVLKTHVCLGRKNKTEDTFLRNWNTEQERWRFRKSLTDTEGLCRTQIMQGT